MKRLALALVLLVGCGSSSNATPTGDDAGADGATDVGGDAATDAPPDGPTVTTDKGPVRGTAVDGVTAFYDIPYAAPPVGALRFKPPAPAIAWTTVRDATKKGLACPQPPDPITKVKADAKEDCLALNVWTPKLDPAAKAPVIVFVHGGSFISGSGNMPLYDGAALAKLGAVVVTINYRLGPLGFLAHPALSAESDKKVSGNYGLLDQQAALAWVKANVATFGGDPGNVTLMGESAGAISVCLHLVSPGAKGLFHRAISESGTCSLVTTQLHDFGTPAEDSAEERGARLANEVGCTSGDVLACLRSKSVDDLIAAGTGGEIGSKELGFAPNIDGFVVPSSPRKLLQTGPANDVPYLLGTNADEGNLFTATVTIGTVDQYNAMVNAIDPILGPKLLEIWPASAFATPKDAWNALVGETLFVCPARETARAVAPRAPVWLYHFEHVTTFGKMWKLGAFHASELFFVFGNFDAPIADPTADETKLSTEMMGYWSRFAKSGDPNGGSAVAWPKYDATTDPHLVLDTTIKAGSGLIKDRCDAFAKLF